VLLYVNGSWNTYWVNGDWTEKTDPGWPLWVTLYQKAYLQAMNVVCRAPDGTYLPFEQWHSTTGAPWKSAGAALTALTGWDYTWVSASSMGAQQMRSRLLAGDILVAATPDFPPSSAVVGDHNYVVCDVYYQNGQWKVLLYNPWGRDGRVCTDGNDDGMVTLGWSEFVAHFSGYRWV
jgi:hypothetical protein